MNTTHDHSSPESPKADGADTARGLSTDLIVDTAGLHIAMDPGMQSIWSGAAIRGATVRTVQVPPGDNLSPGEVLVVNGEGYRGRALCGAIMSCAALTRGVAGLVVDGVVRDRDDTCAMRFPVFARGLSPVGPRRHERGTFDIPIICGGINVAPGDTLFADGDGVVVIPKERTESIIREANERARREAEIFETIRSGTLITSLFGSKAS
jgi:4-hydroxy-4-methyl-2-oxoglutarate aldolase